MEDRGGDEPEGTGAPRRVAVQVTKDALRQVRGGHPWVFDGGITSMTPEGRTGDLAVIFDQKRAFAAIGLYDPDSPIHVRVLHEGKPTPIDADFFRGRIAAALERRAELAADEGTTGYRCVHGENDGLPGLVLDRYGDTYVLKLYTAAWLAHLDVLVEVVDDLVHPERLVLRLARAASRTAPAGAPADGTALLGERPDGPVPYLESGLRMEADVVHGQKTGAFLDQRDNRRRVRDLAAGRRVLDVYACTGGFSVSAAAGGANAVTSIDRSAAAIATAQRTMAANRDDAAVRACHHEVVVGDAVEELERLVEAGRSFDLVVIDPPSFASRASQVDGALRGYARLAELGFRLVAPGGTLVQASCSSRVTPEQLLTAVLEGADAAGALIERVLETGHGIDHPIGFVHGAYLSAVFVDVSEDPVGG